jgi:predicted neuraminidase
MATVLSDSVEPQIRQRAEVKRHKRFAIAAFWSVFLATATLTGVNWTRASVEPKLAETPLTGLNRNSGAAIFEHRFFESVAEAPSVHSSTITELPDGGFLAAWFGGSREGASDVCIYVSRWDAGGERWGTPRVIVDVATASEELGRYIKKLGNPVLHCDRFGRVWLYYVTVSLGGWSGSSISVKHSDDLGANWNQSRRLVSSPFLNISTLVRSVPIDMEDGTVILPVYHEFLAKFGESLHLSRDGEMIRKNRTSWGVDSLQPTFVADGRERLIAYYRRGGNAPPKVLMNESFDSGETWTELRATELPNPNASIAVVRRHNGGFLMALNADETERDDLSLAVSEDGVGWRIVKTLAPAENGLESSYPKLIRASDGTYRMTYTSGREKIADVRFNDAWLDKEK